MPPIKFKTVLQPRGPAAAILLDDEQVEQLGEGKKVFPVRGTINSVSFEGRLARMGGENMIGFSKAKRAEVGVEIGDTFEVSLEVDASERVVDVPPELGAALKKDKAAAKAFDALSYTHRKEFARWVSEAKKDETRERRTIKAVQMILDGETR
ncbi:MAG: YdeI/OmpD-associated family protein [Solirubrobacterales bacterium]